MKRRSLTLLALGGAIVLLVAAGVLVAWHPWTRAAGATASGAGGAATEAEPPAKFVTISALSVDSLQSIELASRPGTIELDDVEGIWKIVKPAVLAVKQGPLQDLLYSVTNLSSERVIEEHPANLAQYGLEPPEVTVRLHLTTGEVRELYLGNMTPAGDSYYLMARGDSRVFTVREHHGTYFHYMIQDLWEGGRTPIDAGNVVFLKLARQGKTVVQLERTEELYRSSIEFRPNALSVVYPWAAAPKPVDSVAVTGFASSLSALRSEVAVDANPGDKAPYGLDHPSAELQLVDNTGNKLHVFTGTVDGPVLFLQFEGDPTVYAGDARLLDLLNVDPFQFVNKYAVIVKLDRVDRLEIARGGTRHVLEVRRKTPGSEDGAEWLVDGHAVAVKAFKNFYTDAMSLQIDGLHDGAATGAAEVTMTFMLNSGSARTFTASFVPYSQEFYAVLKGGKGDILVNRQQVKVLLEELDSLASAASGS